MSKRSTWVRYGTCGMFGLILGGWASAESPLAADASAAFNNAADHNPSVWLVQFDPARESIVSVLGPGIDPSGGGGVALRGGGLTADFLEPGVLPEGDGNSGAAFTPDGATLIIAHRDSQNLSVYDAATRAFLGEVALSGSPGDVAVTPDGLRAVTANLWEDTASIVDLATLSETAVVPVGNQPGVVRISPDGAAAVVGNTVDGTLSVIDIATASETRQISGADFTGSLSVNFEPGALALSFSGFEFVDATTVVHTDFFGDAVSFYDITTGAANDVPVGDAPFAIAVTPDGTKGVVSHRFTPARQISVLDLTTQSVSKTIGIGVDVWGPIAISPDGGKAAVGVQNAVRIVNLVTDAVSGNLDTASVNQLLNTTSGLHVLGVGFRGSLIGYASESIATNLNNVVSTSFGAISPTDPRAVMVATTFGQDMLVVNTDGAGGFLEFIGPSGPAPEADATRMAAISPDGSIGVTTNLMSDSASVIDVASGAVLAVLEVGDRPADVEITPDGSKAVVANLDSSFASVIDLNTLTVTNVNISTRASEVEISPDGAFAYLAVVASGDGVWRIDLNTLTTSGGKLLTGNMGSIGFLHSQASGMTLSPDGGTLVTCNTFDHNVSIIDTAAWTERARLATGAAPVRAAFSPDSSAIYIANRDDDSVSVISNSNPPSVTATISVGDRPFEMAADPDAPFLYVLNFGDENVGRIDLNANTQVDTLPLPSAPAGIDLDSAADRLYVASGTWSVTLGPGPLTQVSRAGEFTVIDTATWTVADQLDTGHPPSDQAVSVAGGVALVPSPLDDGAVRVRFGVDCPGDVNGNGSVGVEDLGILLANFGNSPADPADGDLNDDDTVDATDLGILLANFGAVCR